MNERESHRRRMIERVSNAWCELVARRLPPAETMLQHQARMTAPQIRKYLPEARRRLELLRPDVIEATETLLTAETKTALRRAVAYAERNNRDWPRFINIAASSCGASFEFTQAVDAFCSPRVAI